MLLVASGAGGSAGSVRRLTTLGPFSWHVYIDKYYNSNHKWKIIQIRTLHDLGDMSHVTLRDISV
jgi:hypothetical protein